ncbi:MAG: pilus assembly protein [Woeseiaceae bacterium]|nr:pilus assembly protein [Woeseiaceae bacterium]NIP20789.1 pilus assembly protein [Woeseiaceae bacterium]NIS89582.1 pilus assembly protein [Woeseiaceae bacterium]
MNVRRRQRGLAIVEFAIVAAVLFILIFAVIEVGRAFFVAATLDEAARRGARMAVVCPVNDPAISQAAAFDNAVIPDLDASDISVEYLSIAGNPLGSPATTDFRQIRFIRVAVVGYQHQMFIPFATALLPFTMPDFTTVLPRESLGIPRTGAITPC